MSDWACGATPIEFEEGAFVKVAKFGDAAFGVLVARACVADGELVGNFGLESACARFEAILFDVCTAGCEVVSSSSATCGVVVLASPVSVDV
jgi:hypothetical protein